MIFIVAMIITNARQSHQYFSYENCGETCKIQGLPCNIIRVRNTFEVQCVGTPDCEDQSNDDIPCIADDRPTLGGIELWPIFKEKIKPKPKETQSCLGWKIWVSIQSGIETIIMVIFITMKYKRYRARIEYEEIPEPAADSPYRPTVEAIPPTED